MKQNQNKINIILFNLGGPSDLKSVPSFLFNLFSDALIIRLPSFLRLCLAWLISTLRTKKAQHIYSLINGKSPILENTEKQGKALLNALNKLGYNNVEIHTVMRYWNPRAKDVINNMKWDNDQETLLLPLYPQYSTTTTLSSMYEFISLMKKKYPYFKYTKIGCYPVLPGLIQYYTKAISNIILSHNLDKPHILFSAHGLPIEVIQDGDPYQHHVQQTILAIKSQLELLHPQIFAHECYQSKVGPKKWLTPSTEHLIEELSKQDENIIVAPIAFVSEHSETLVELDIEYKEIAHRYGAKSYHRVATPDDDVCFIRSLAELVSTTLDGKNQDRYCSNFHDCFCHAQLKNKGNTYVKCAHNFCFNDTSKKD